jgi:DNA end-binding protein Ku
MFLMPWLGKLRWSVVEYVMAPRAYWKGYLRLSLVSCPIQLFPATAEGEKISFNQLNKETGNRVRYRKVDEGTGHEVPSDNIVKAYQISKGQYIELTDDELDAVAVESTRTIDIDQFVPKTEIDDLYYVRPYYIAPEGDVGLDAFLVIRNAIEQMDMVALGRVVLTSREHVIALEPRGKGLMGTLLRYPYEVRAETEYFEDIPDRKIAKDMMDLAKHIVETKAGHFHPEQFEDHYETALKELIDKKAKGVTIAPRQQRPAAPVIDLMEALRRSATSGPSGKSPSRPKGTKKKIPGQKEMLLPITGKKAATEETRRPAKPSRQRNAG